MSEHEIRLRVNGVERSAWVPAQRLLADFLRDECGLTGTKVGCGVGVCGACTVMVDGELLSGCLVPAVLVDGCDVRTVEGLADGERLTALQEAFIRHGGFQCGICTPGQLVAATALLERRPRPTPAEIREWMLGNLCRCTGYYGIERAIRSAAGEAVG